MRISSTQTRPTLFQSRVFHFFSHFFLTLIVLGLLTACGGSRTIVNDLDEREANEILVYLSNKGVDAHKVPAVSTSAGGNKTPMYNISVDEGQASEAMALLNQVGLPRRRGQNLLGIFSNVGLVPSGMQDKIRYQAGLAEQIASTIRKIDGVLDAEVQLSFPEEDPLNPTAQKGKITSSVYVKHNGILDDPNAHLQTRIKRLVAGSVNGLDYDNVTVIGDRARYGDASSVFSSGGDEAKQYTSVWSLVLAKDSVTRFRIIFFSFILTLLALIAALGWLVWKLLPIIKELKQRKELLTLHQIEPKDLIPQETEKEKSESEDEDEDEDENQDAEEEEEEDNPEDQK